jgi:hypothetical protein
MGCVPLTKKGRMPLPSYLWIHRDAGSPDADVKTLCAWSDKCGILSMSYAAPSLHPRNGRA